MRLSSPARIRSPRLQHLEIQSLLLQLHASTNIEECWAALQSLLAQAAPHDAMVAYLNFFDFASSWQAAKILSTPNASRPVTWFEGRRQVDMTPSFVLAQPEKIKIYRLSDVIPDERKLQNTSFYRDYLAPAGWHYLAVSLFWRGTTVCSQVALRRTKAQGDFSAQEIRLLRELHPHIGTVLNRLIFQEEERARRSWLEKFNDHLPFALLFLDLDLAPMYVNREGMEQCALWNFGPAFAHAYQPRDVFRVPDEILTACRELKSRWLAERAQPEAPNRWSNRRTHARHPGLVANLTLQTETPFPAAKPGFIIHLSRESDSSRNESSFPILSMLGRLTTAEREIARLVLAGKSNEEIASELGKSINTVKSQLTLTYRKLGVSSRSQLLARRH